MGLRQLRFSHRPYLPSISLYPVKGAKSETRRLSRCPKTGTINNKSPMGT